MANLGAEAQKFAALALETVVAICEGEVKGVMPRDRLATANTPLDRGFGKPTQSIDLIMLGKTNSELSTAELIELNSRLSSSGALTGEPKQRELH
jgi:hypothetical protein